MHLIKNHFAMKDGTCMKPSIHLKLNAIFGSIL